MARVFDIVNRTAQPALDLRQVKRNQPDARPEVVPATLDRFGQAQSFTCEEAGEVRTFNGIKGLDLLQS